MFSSSLGLTSEDYAKKKVGGGGDGWKLKQITGG